MGARTKARKRALDVIFEAEQRGADVRETLAGRVAAGSPPVAAYTVELVEGVAAQGERIDELLSTYSESWTLDRMPAIDRNVLRLGVYELLYAEDVPDGVAVSEAMALVRELSTDESPPFVNGVLGNIQRNKSTLG